MAEAVKALTRGTSLAKAAAIAGHASVPAFGATFRAVFGMTPRQMQQIGKT